MRVTGLKNCYEMAKACYPTAQNHSLRKRLRFSLRLFCGYREAANKVESFFTGTPLRRFIMSLPDFRERVYVQQVRPSFYRNSIDAHRTLFLTSHFKFLEKTHKEEVVRQLYSQSLSPVLFSEGDSALSFSISYHPSILKEGLLRLSVSANNVCLYRIVFWLMDYHGVPTLCISALQGGKDTLQENHAFTKQYWGLRPQNMAMTVLRLYAKAAGIKQIYTFAKKDLLCEKIARQTDLDQFWQEQGAVPVVHSPFIKLAMESPRKELSEVATRKRSTYKKRYEFLDRFQPVLAEQFALYMERSPVVHDLPFSLIPQGRIAQHMLGRRERRRTSSAMVSGVAAVGS
jgi:uncharacterized protein VirK/YbjX